MALLWGSKVQCLKSNSALHIAHPTFRDDSFFASNDAFASLVIEQMEQDSNFAGFGQDFPKENYHLLRNQFIEAETMELDIETKESRIQNLAKFLDQMIKYFIKFLNSNSPKVSRSKEYLR